MGILQPSGSRIVVGVDCSPGSSDVLRWAANQADLTGAELVALTSRHLDYPGIDDDDSFEMDIAVRHALTGVLEAALGAERAGKVKLRTAAARPADALLAQSRKADLVVVGPHSGFDPVRWLLGSVTERVLSGAACPVAVVRLPALGQPSAGPIVVGLDGSDCSRRAMQWALRQSEHSGTPVEAIVAWSWQAAYDYYPFGPDTATIQNAATQLLARELAALKPAQPSLVRGVVHSGHPADVLLAAALTATLIVVGNHGAGATVGRVLGSVSQKVARHAPIPVVVVHDHDHTAYHRALPHT